jgi:hypothetical protein
MAGEYNTTPHRHLIRRIRQPRVSGGNFCRLLATRLPRSSRLLPQIIADLPEFAVAEGMQAHGMDGA